MNAVSNTGPLIALAKIDQLSLLKKLFSELVIPPVVHSELLAKRGVETDRLEAAINQFIRVSSQPDFPSEVKIATLRLDFGEQQAVALAYQSQKLIILDDQLGRTAAKQLSLSMTGTAGILILAKKAGLILEVRSQLETIRNRGYWLSDKLVELASKLAAEEGL